jgi:hypothetical protein
MMASDKKIDKFAYATLVFGKNDYYKGAIVMAHSLRMTGTKHDILCIVTKDVPKEAITVLKVVFNKVIPTDYIEFKSKPMATQKQQKLYSDWMSKSYTKWAVLGLDKFGYTKVCFLDSDLIIIQNLDHLFDYSAPVGCFTSLWVEGGKVSGIDSYPHKPRFVNYFKDFKNGDKVSTEIASKALVDGFVINGHCVVLPTGDLKEFKAEIEKKAPFGFGGVSMVDEQSIVYFESIIKKRDWTYIGHEYNMILWHYDDIVRITGKEVAPKIIHCALGEKPWQLTNLDYFDVQLWYLVARQLAISHPNFLDLFGKLVLSVETCECPYCKSIKKEYKHQFVKDNKVVCPVLAK